MEMEKRTEIKKKMEEKKFPDYCTGHYRQDPETEKGECPRCGNALPMHTGALSWDGKTEICPECGDLEGLEALIFGYNAYDPYRNA